ncbi:hypothetical protein ACWD5V_16055 [Streptomyces sp. NPDC002523]
MDSTPSGAAADGPGRRVTTHAPVILTTAVLATAVLGVGICVAVELVALVAASVAMPGAEARWGFRGAEVREPAPA